MAFTQAVPATNRLLDALHHKDREQLLTNCEHMELNIGEVLYRAGAAIPHVYFPTGGFISLLAPVDSSNLELGLVGNEGVLGITLILGVDSAPFTALVQGTGTALRITTASFLHILEQSAELHQVLKRYLYVSMSQLAQSAACTRFHLVEGRLARWLLMTKDRAHSDHIHITHVFLAYMLGVRRVGVTKAANSLQQQKLISYQRGDITILDHDGLEAASCGCYQADKEIYERILGRVGQPSVGAMTGFRTPPPLQTSREVGDWLLRRL
ncbi:cyclic nucleotide-binding domain protein [Methyloglobulus morosus KoM1]|uniref:Cyclic nucleotide-binding domain protein n=1 Tax=Methyloglobulus morosus KoM1 TaxID=1116472 RepID=V5B3H1_9GAMM|nr:Crp/Fnr family transcriptional regulator [Methyloglobulus morosus]ESS67730.1 cyclic nucleotide-binding domain protein [Methyloglobulus morosus KoM1]